jgi:hypothetical protein
VFFLLDFKQFSEGFQNLSPLKQNHLWDDRHAYYKNTKMAKQKQNKNTKLVLEK